MQKQYLCVPVNSKLCYTLTMPAYVCRSETRYSLPNRRGAAHLAEAGNGHTVHHRGPGVAEIKISRKMQKVLV